MFGTAGALLQLHDLYPNGGYHPCLGIISAAWAVWQGSGKPASVFMDAVVAGYEVANRLGDALAMAQIRNGFTPTATMGGIGGAVAAGRVLGLDAKAMAAAIGNATLCCPATPFQALSDHGNAVPLHGGLAARGGVQAALLAQAGWSAGAHAADGFGGLFRLAAGDGRRAGRHRAGTLGWRHAGRRRLEAVPGLRRSPHGDRGRVADA